MIDKENNDQELQSAINKIPSQVIEALKRDLPIQIARNKARYEEERAASREAYMAKLGTVERQRLEAFIERERLNEQ